MLISSRGWRAAIFAALLSLAGAFQHLSAQEAATGAQGDRIWVTGLTDSGGNVPLGAEARLSTGGSLPVEQVAPSEADPEGALVFLPKFPLLPGADYTLVLEGRALHLPIRRLQADRGPARVGAIAPAGTPLPANTLRMYVTFDQPMARGTAMAHIRLLDDAGDVVRNAFLNLGVELWNADQTRLTLVFDPGRLKQGVGPNTAHGAPFDEGETYRLIVDGGMRTADGGTLSDPAQIVFEVEAPDRRRIDIAAWDMSQPRAGSRDTLEIRFHRVMDPVLSRRTLAVIGADRTPLAGKLDIFGTHMHFTPAAPWPRSAAPFLYVAPHTEDIAGNRTCGSFDVRPGSEIQCDRHVERPIAVRR